MRPQRPGRLEERLVVIGAGNVRIRLVLLASRAVPPKVVTTTLRQILGTVCQVWQPGLHLQRSAVSRQRSFSGEKP